MIIYLTKLEPIKLIHTKNLKNATIADQQNSLNYNLWYKQLS